MTEREDIEMTAAEYVLGTLDASERAEVDRRRLSEPELDAMIAVWQTRLAPLDATATPVAPADGVFRDIEARIGQRSVGDRSRGSQSRAMPPSATIIALERRVARWRRATVAAGALAASLAIAIAVREIQPGPVSQNFVAVFQKDDAQPAFLMSVDLKTRELTIRAVTADRQLGKAYQLWILAEPLGPVPRSLGLLEASLSPTRKTLADYEPSLLQNAVFGISVEPPGGSPTGRPTGPALHGKLLPATP